MKLKEVPKYLKGVIVRKTRHFLLQESFEKDVTHSVTIWTDFISVRPLPSNHMLIIGQPDTSMEPDKDYETSIYVCDHAHILIRGHKKGDLEILIKSDEYPTKLTIDEGEGVFKK